MHAAFIVNLLAGRGQSKKLWGKLEPLLKRQHSFKVYYTRQAGDAVRLARVAQDEGASLLVPVGGDGTIYEVINGIDLSRGTLLGLLPTGTGNDLCKSLGYPKCPFTIAEQLFHWPARPIDLGKTGQGYFANVIGAGFDGQVAYDINYRIKFLTGKAAYLAGILKNLVTYRNTALEVEYDGRCWEGKALLIAIGNGGCYGGGLQIVPPAVLDDGYFHICLVKDVGKIETMRLLPSVYRGGHIGHPEVEILKARRVTVRAPVPLTVQADGEIIGTLPLSVEVAPRALNVLAPHNQPEYAQEGICAPAALAK